MRQTTLRNRLTAAVLLVALALAAAPTFAAETKKAVNINTADASQLALLPRVGPSVAQRILDYRKANGAFKKPEELMLVRGIGEKTFALIRPYVAIAGDTTLREKVRATKAEEKNR
jgi:competence protein ComEA